LNEVVPGAGYSNAKLPDSGLRKSDCDQDDDQDNDRNDPNAAVLHKDLSELVNGDDN
jgi:hypothetical protein